MATSWKKFLAEQQARSNAVQKLSTWTGTPTPNVEIPKWVSNIIKSQAPKYPSATITETTPEQKAQLKEIEYVESPRNIIDVAKQWVQRVTSKIAGKDIGTAYEQGSKMIAEDYEISKQVEEKGNKGDLLFEWVRTWTSPIDVLAKSLGIDKWLNEWWTNNEWDTVYLTNWNTIVSKPIVRSLDSTSTLWDAYNSITYEYAQNWGVLTAEQIKETYPEWQDVSDDTINAFIQDCLYDVETDNRRDINQYADFYGALSVNDNYANKQDSLLDALTDEDIIAYWISAFAWWAEKLEWRTPEEIIKYIQSAMIIKNAAKQFNEFWYNISWASDYNLVRSVLAANKWEADIKELQDAFNTYTNFNLTANELNKIQETYDTQMNTLRELRDTIESWDTIEYNRLLSDYANKYISESFNSKVNAMLKETYAGDSPRIKDKLYSLMFWNAYEEDGKYYDTKWNELKQDEVSKWISRALVDSWINLWNQLSDLDYDIDRTVNDRDNDRNFFDQINVDYEKLWRIWFDIPSTVFAGIMSLTPGWAAFTTATGLPYIWAKIDNVFNYVMGGIADIAIWLWNLIWFSDWWNEKTIEKYGEAVSAVSAIKIAQWLKILGRKWVDYLKYKTAIGRAVKVYTDRIKAGAKLVDVLKEKEKIRRTTTPKLPEETWDTTWKIESKAKDVKSKVDVDIQWAKYKMQITKAVFQDALNNFHKTFQEEAAKIKEETGWETILDTLFETASKLFKDSQKLRVAEWEVVENIPETVRDVTEISVQEPTKTTTEPQREATIESEAMPAPEVRVEETVTETPETVEWTAEVKETEWAKEVKTTIAKILDLMKDIEDNAKEAVDNIFKPDLEKQTRKEIEEREARDELFRREWLTEKQIEIVENNPFTDSVMRIVDRLVSEITDKKWNVKDARLEDKMSNDEIQREILSDGLTRMQKYVDRIQQMKKAIWKLYDALSTQKNIRSRQFLYSEPFQRLLRENWLEYVERIDDKGNPKRAVVANDGRVLSANERAVAKYIESMTDIITEKSWISEKDAHNIRTNFTSKGDWDSSGNFPKAVKKALYERWNEFLEQQGSSEMLRKIDQGYAELSENLEVLSDLLWKDSMLKDNAKNQILKRDEKTLDQMESILPGIKKLVELTKQSPDIVNKTIKAKTQYKQTRVWLGNWIRYAWVMMASTVGWRWGFILGSLGFTTLERLWNALKSKAVKTKLDRNLYNQYVEALKVDWNTKASFKKGEIERYNELSKIAEWKTQAEIDKLLDDATQILIDRQATKIREQKQAEWERYLRSQWVWDTTPRLPESTQGWVVATDTFTLPEDRWVKETYKDKEKTQQGYNQAEQQIIDASLWKTEETKYSPEAEKVADILEKSLNETADIIEEDATNKVIEKGEELTDENIAKEIQKEPSSIEEFIMEAEKWAPEETTNYDGADIKDLEEVVANPKKYPNVDIEAAKAALEKARRQNQQAEIMQSPDQQQAQKEIAWIYKGNQMEREWNKGREKQREDMVRETNRDFDTLETTEEYDRIENQITPEKWEQAKKYAKWYKGFYRSDKAKTDELRADMGKKPSQNITYTSSADKIATLESPKTRARVAQERLDKRKRLSEEERTQLNQIIEQANVEIQAKEELKAQKTELANEYKALDKKRSETPYRENKREYTKQMDKISDEFDKLTYEEQGQFAKPKEVEAEEIKEAERIEEERQNLDMNETPQKAEPEIKKQETKKESEWERSFWDEEYTNRDNKIEEMSKDESITIKDTIKEVDEIVWWWIKDYQEKIYWEKRDKEESYTNDWAESFRNRVNDKIGERDRKFWEDQRSKTKDMESSKLTKEQEKQLEEAKTKEEKDALMNKWRKEYIERNPIAEKYLKEAEEHNKQFQKAMNALGKLDAITRRIRRKRREDIDKRWEEAKRKLREEKKKGIDLLDQNETPQITEPEMKKEVTIDDIEYNKSKNPDMLELEVYKWRRGYPIKNTPWANDNVTFYTDNQTRASQFWPITKEIITIPKDKVKIIDSDGISFSSKVDKDWNVIKGRAWDTEDNYVNYNNKKAREEWYDAIIYRNITDIGPKTTSDITAKADDIVLLKKEPTTQKKPEPNNPTWWSPLVDVSKDGTVNKEPGLWDYTTDQIQKRIDELKKKRQDNWKKLYAQDLSELRVLQDLLKRQIERENREEWSTELTDRQREILNSNNYGDEYRAGWAWTSED